MVRMANGSSREGWIYVYNRHPGKAKLVRSGDYLRSKSVYPAELPE